MRYGCVGSVSALQSFSACSSHREIDDSDAKSL